MRTIVILLLAFIFLAPSQAQDRPPIVQDQQGNSINLRVEGSLAPAHELKCISLANANNSYTPPDLYTGVSECIKEGNFEQASRLFALAGLYTKYDTERITDPTVQSGGQVLILRTFTNVSAEQKAQFSSAVQKLAKMPDLLTLCSEISRIGLPSYFPRYLILHGMNAFTSSKPIEDATKPDFDSESTWARLKETYLGCAK